MGKVLGIDYGTQRVGIAVSDETGTLAFARNVYENDKTLEGRITQFCRIENIEFIVIGESKDFRGVDNPIGKAIAELKKHLESELGVPIVLQPEFLTTVEARRVEGSSDARDAHAAAVILQRYLDKQNA